jgi:hypothetical protein
MQFDASSTIACTEISSIHNQQPNQTSHSICNRQPDDVDRINCIKQQSRTDDRFNSPHGQFTRWPMKTHRCLKADPSSVETTPRSRNFAHGTVEVQVWSCGLLWICLACSPASMRKCLLQASRVPHPAAGCKCRQVWIRRTLVSYRILLCELISVI